MAVHRRQRMERPGQPGGRCANLAVVGARSGDGSAGDADYGVIAACYTRYRRPDARIAARIGQALGAARTVLNVGAGTGSYEPADREVIPVEPSASTRRTTDGRRPCSTRPRGATCAPSPLSTGPSS